MREELAMRVIRVATASNLMVLLSIILLLGFGYKSETVFHFNVLQTK